MTEEKNEKRARIEEISPLENDINNLLKDSKFVLIALEEVGIGSDNYPIIRIALKYKSK
ncbi:MAG: hypothetical protein [Lokiarchaeia virus VerdaV1]|uniref:Uncharacterized protein n=1 Tax=Lokiarchaeia virus VerdaV1 TaxID=3070170 RepID=A0AA35CPH5_9CAUD|nr:MAG: hypothetical protein QIT41_gp45 [Lokiarchaeia virus VerdaV1]BDI54894.1 MAG: hypothetical protein [Lokiarchaeia virus VerdaV1]